jgi:hypothetical protein
MGKRMTPPRGGTASRARLWNGAILAAIGVQVAQYLYLYVYIFQHANPRGDGMEWVAAMPATFVLAAGAGPALFLHSRARLLPLALLLALIGIVLNAAFLFEIAREFAESGS